MIHIDDDLKKDWILAKYGFSDYVIESLIENGIDISTIETMSQEEFNVHFGRKRSKLYQEIKNTVSKIDKDDLESNTIYILIGEGISKTSITKLESCGYKTLDDLAESTSDEIKVRTGLGERRSDLLFTCLEKKFNIMIGSYENYLNVIREAMIAGKGINSTYLASICKINPVIVNKIVNNMMSEGLIRYTPKGMEYVYPTINKILEKLDEEKRTIIQKRIAGETLETIGNEKGLTRERIRQIISKVIARFPEVKEDRYKEFFKKYKFTRPEFVGIFGVPEYEYNYLKIRYPMGKDDIDYDEIRKMGFDCSSYIDAQEKKNYLNIGGVKVKKRAVDMLRYVISTMNGYFELSDIENNYRSFLDDNGLSIDDYDNVKTIQNNYYNYGLINCYTNGYKRFNVTKDIIVLLRDELCLNSYKDTIISTRKLFELNSGLMDSLNISDEYELHNILKIGIGYRGYIDIDITFLRMPILQFGESSKEKVTKQSIYDHAPIKISDFVELMECEYGFKKNSFLSCIFSDFSRYIDDDTLRVDIRYPSNDEIVSMSKILTSDFYFLDDYIDIVEENHLNEYYLTDQYIVEFGYTKYSGGQGYILRSSKTSKDYFKNILMSNDVIDMKKFDKRLKGLSAFTGEIYELEKDMDIIQMTSNIYLTFKRLNERLGITKEEIDDYLSKLLDFVGDGYFTVKKLIKDGFDEKFTGLGFDDVVYQSLFKHLDNVASIVIGGNLVFKVTKNKINRAIFIEDIVCDSEKMSMTIYDLSDMLDEVYGINIDLNDLKYIISLCNLYYNNTLEKVYISHDQFIEEVV